MSSVIAQLVSAAIVGIVSPVAIMAAIALLTSRRPVANLLAFFAGWNIVLILLAVVVQALFGSHHAATSTGAKGAVDFILGVLLLVLGLRGLVGEHHPLKETVEKRRKGGTAKGPAWLAQITEVGPLKAVGLGMLTIAVSPGNVAVFLSAMQGLAGAGIDSGTRLIATIVLLLAISLAILIPLGIYLLMPQRSDELLGRLREWLATHDRVLVAWVSLVFGVVLLLKGVTALN